MCMCGHAEPEDNLECRFLGVIDFYFLKGFIFICVSVECTLCFQGAYKGQKRMSDLLELGSQVVVSHVALELETVLGSSAP